MRTRRYPFLPPACLAALCLLPLTRGQSAAAWQGDLRVLTDAILEMHCDATRLIAPAELRRRSQRLHGRIPHLQRAEIVLELARLVAALGDGHSGIALRQQAAGFRSYPFYGVSFADGFFVLDAMPGHEKLAGARLAAIEGMDAEHAFTRLRPFVSSENDGHARLRVDSLLRTPEVLFAAGIAPRSDRARFTFLRGRERIELELRAVARKRYGEWIGRRRRAFFRPPAMPASKHYWFELREASRTLYVYFCAARDEKGGESVTAFVDRLRRFADKRDFDRFVLDLRDHPGGSANYTVPFVRLLETHPKINRRGRLFTLVSPFTYSAAMLMCGMLENRTRTLFVGERTGQGVNLFGDARWITLPASKLRVSLSERWWQCGIPEDRRTAIEPDLFVAHRHADQARGRDAGLAAILAFRPEERPAAPPSRTELDRYVGRFRFSPYQELVITRAGRRLAMRIRDRVDGPSWLAEVVSDLRPTGDRFLTDMRGVTMRRAAGTGPAESIVLCWRGTVKASPRMSGTEQLAIVRADGDNVRAQPRGMSVRKGPSDPPKELEPSTVRESLALLLKQRDALWEKMMVAERLNILGYRFLRTRNLELATEVFRTNAELFPRWWNAHDSLAEAWMERGRYERAKRLYRRSLELNPENTNASKMLKRISRLEKRR